MPTRRNKDAATPASRRRAVKVALAIILVATPVSVGLFWLVFPAGPMPTTHMVRMRDGVYLATDLYLPAGEGPFPAILYRTPYDKNTDPGPLYVLDHGVALVAQDHRGCHASGGEYEIFGMDGPDANDTVAWMNAQPWFNGKYATTGGSARGITQYMQVGHLHDIRCQLIEVATPDLFSIAGFQGGAPRKMLAENWLAGIGHPESYARLYEDLSSSGAFATNRRVNPWEWGNVTWPAIHRGGWFDCFGQGTIDGFSGYHYHGGEGGKGMSKLVMGPWTHDHDSTDAGELVFPDNARIDPWTTKIFESMFMERLLGIVPGEDWRAMPNVTYYVMGDTTVQDPRWNRWATSDRWPVPYMNHTLYLQGNGTMSSTAPVDAANMTYIFDPRDPVLTRGGANLLGHQRGPFDQRSVEAGRKDVLHFDFPVVEPVLLTGRVWARLFVMSNATDTDYSVKLMDVHPDGEAMLLADGIVRMRYRNGMDHETFLDGSNATIYEAMVDLWSTSYYFNAGHVLRITVSSSNYPRFDVNPNTGAVIAPINESMPMLKAQNTLVISPAHAPALILPVPLDPPSYA